MRYHKQLSPDALAYLEEVFGYKNVSEVDEHTLFCICENVRDSLRPEDSRLDVEIVEAYILAGLPVSQRAQEALNARE